MQGRLEMPARVASAGVMGIITAISLLVGGVWFSLIVAIGALAALREWHQKWHTVGQSLAEVRDRCQRLLSGYTQLQSSNPMDGA